MQTQLELDGSLAPDNTVERLAQTLQLLDNHPDRATCVSVSEHGNWIMGPSVEGHDELSEELKFLLTEINRLADGILITPRGECHWSNHKKLEDLGYKVRKGESDSFGWLTGVIHLKCGNYCYG